MMGVFEPIDCRTEICIPDGVTPPAGSGGKIALHNDPSTDHRKAWSWDRLGGLVKAVGPEQCVLDLRGKTTLAEAAAIIRGLPVFLSAQIRG